jgi:hypothetical protein
VWYDIYIYIYIYIYDVRRQRVSLETADGWFCKDFRKARHFYNIRSLTRVNMKRYGFKSMKSFRFLDD